MLIWRTFCRFFNRHIKVIGGLILSLILIGVLIGVLISTGLLSDNNSKDLIGLALFLGILIIVLTTSLKFSGTILKASLFLVYHMFVFGLIWYVFNWLWVPIFETQWIYGFDWVRATTLAVSYLAFCTGLLLSIASCFDNTKMSATEIGQWTAMGWMPESLKNQKNSFGGYFSGLPSKMVKMKNYTTVATTYLDKQNMQIQIETGDTNKSKFAADFDFTYVWVFCDTFIQTKNRCSPEVLLNLVKKFLTEWLNGASKFCDISDLKKEILTIERDVFQEFTKTAMELYGIEIKTFKLVNIEVPQIQIEQQNLDAKSKIAQIAQDEREKLNVVNQRQKVAEHIKFIKETTGEAMSWKDASRDILVLEGTIKVNEIKENSGRNNRTVPVVQIPPAP